MHCADDPDRALGFAAHSLRAVAPEVLTRTLQDAGNLAPGVPVHIHVAEQQKKVAECRALNGRTPIAWLHETCPVDQNWCLVHATHAEPDELRSIVESDATVGLCPTTEANLGDGVFPAAEFLQSGGYFGIGSDSQVCTAPSEELKLLEYAQRLSLQRRTVLVKDDEGSVGRSLVELVLAGGNRAWARVPGGWFPVPGQTSWSLITAKPTSRRCRRARCWTAGFLQDQGPVMYPTSSSAAGTWWSMVCMPCWNPLRYLSGRWLRP
ncbi:MAG: hypothetical protein Ct9H300mP16_04510 [Pseudomonadota bacterium]|nr:MAG: hypothetical protein Ct9H300mP16_04510 [Pseudomonadota bacterium]